MKRICLIIAITIAMTTMILGQRSTTSNPGNIQLNNGATTNININGAFTSGSFPTIFFNDPSLTMTDFSGDPRISLFGGQFFDPEVPLLSLTGTVPFGESKYFMRITNDQFNDYWNVGLQPDDFGSSLLFNYNDGNSFTATATINTGGVFVSSDKKLKQNIITVNSALQSLMSVNPTHYNRKQNPTKGEYGFIAQEIEKIYPEMVMTVNTEDGVQYLMNYQQMIPILTKAIQEQQELISEQSTLIENLNTRIDILEN